MFCREPRWREPRTCGALSWSASARHPPVHRHEVSPATANLAGQARLEPLASSPRDPFGSDHAPQFRRSMDAIIFDALGSINSTRRGVSWNSRIRPRPSAQTASVCGSSSGSIEPESFEGVARMPVDSALIASRQGKPRDLGRPVADRDQRHATGSAAAQANARDLVKRHVDHTAHSQPALLSTCSFPPWGKNPADIKENAQPLAWVGEVVLT